MVDSSKPMQVACQIRKACIQNVCDTMTGQIDVSFSVPQIPHIVAKRHLQVSL